MKSRKNYFRNRRQRLRRRHVCTRCGENPAVKDHALCAGCAVIQKAKREVAPSNLAKSEQRAREKLALVDLARSQLMRRFQHVA